MAIGLLAVSAVVAANPASGASTFTVTSADDLDYGFFSTQECVPGSGNAVVESQPPANLHQDGLPAVAGRPTFESDVGYLRVSTSGQADNGLGLEVQCDRVTEFAAAKGYELLDVVTEAASGGIRNGEEVSYEHRPVLLELIARAKGGGDFDVLLVAKLDRLSRDYPSLAILERKLQKAGVEVVSIIVRNPVYAGERYGVKGAQPAIVSTRLRNAANRALQARSRN
jgi:hypothetical protein